MGVAFHHAQGREALAGEEEHVRHVGEAELGLTGAHLRRRGCRAAPGLDVDVEAGLFVEAHLLGIEIRRMISAGDAVQREGDLLRGGLRCAKRNERRERGFRDDLHTGLQTSGLRIGASFSTRGECYNVDVIRNAIGARERDEFMTSHWQDWPPQVLAALRKGVVIPAHPLALNAERKLDTRRQRALTRYYLDSGAGGLAVCVHTTQFAIREAALFEPVLELAMRSAAELTREPKIMIAGLVGRTAQAAKEAEVARALGYHAGLLSFAALTGASADELIAHAHTIARELPLVGFYLHPAVGGHVLPATFCPRFAAIENVVAIKVAPFNRYRTLDVGPGGVAADAAARITLHTGNDHHIILDLLPPLTPVAHA